VAKAPAWEPPPDPDFEHLARETYSFWESDAPDVVAWDTETTGLTYFDSLFCVTFCWPGLLGPTSGYVETVKYDGSGTASSILKNTPIWVGHNLKFDIQKALLAGLITTTDVAQREEKGYLHDTQALAHMDDEHRDKKLKSLAVELLHYDDTIEVPYSGTRGKNGETRKVSREKYELDTARRKLKLKKEDGFHLLPRGIVVPYAIKDAEFTYSLYDLLMPRVARFEDLSSLYRQEMELMVVLLGMEEAGIAVDEEYLAQRITEYRNRVLRHEAKVAEIVGKPVGDGDDEFNPNSNPQLREFFEAEGQARESYDAANLKQMDHPLAAALIEMRADAKILSTYFAPMQKEMEDGILHPSFRQHGTVTGRMSSGGSEG